MIAVDTNVLLRLIIADDANQLNMAEMLIATEDIYISTTVALETEWVLRSRYRFDRKRISDTLRAIIALPRVSVERPDRFEWALARYADRGDFGDLIHLVSLPPSVTAFATFDANLPTDAGVDVPVAVRQLSGN